MVNNVSKNILIKDFNNNIGIKNDNMILNNDNGTIKKILIKIKYFL